jgi:hypothetical protein
MPGSMKNPICPTQGDYNLYLQYIKLHFDKVLSEITETERGISDHENLRNVGIALRIGPLDTNACPCKKHSMQFRCSTVLKMTTKTSHMSSMLFPGQPNQKDTYNLLHKEMISCKFQQLPTLAPQVTPPFPSY